MLYEIIISSFRINRRLKMQGEDFYDTPMAYFEWVVQERFGMTIEELCALPVGE